jgi:hypothetical protein
MNKQYVTHSHETNESIIGNKLKRNGSHDEMKNKWLSTNFKLGNENPDYMTNSKDIHSQMEIKDNKKEFLDSKNRMQQPNVNLRHHTTDLKDPAKSIYNEQMYEKRVKDNKKLDPLLNQYSSVKFGYDKMSKNTE